MEDSVLLLCKQEEYPPYLLKAIKVAVALLNQVSLLPRAVSPKVADRLLTNVAVEFHADENGEYGWTTYPQDVIFVNRVMRDRLELLTKRRKKDTKEYHSLVFMMAVVIAHGCANLLGRWMSTTQTRGVPTRIRKFREHLDTKVFRGCYRLLIKKPPGAQANEWTKTMRVVELVVQRMNRDTTVCARELRTLLRVAPDDIPDLGTVKPMVLKRVKGAVIHLDLRPPAPVAAPPAAAQAPRPSKKRRTN